MNADGTGLSDANDIAAQPCYDQQALMRRYDIVSEICDAMIDLGWGPYQNDHEDGNGQFEMNWDYSDALRHGRSPCVLQVHGQVNCGKHGLRATFMPKPFANLTGNGCHAHVSVWDRTGETCIFDDEAGELGISDVGYHFLGGVLHHAEALAAITNPTVNSYKRINAPRTVSGATWSPNSVTYGGNNRTHMVRIPDPGRFEFRLADGAANPYLLQSVYLAAGMRGMDDKMDCGKRLDIDMYAEGHTVTDARKLPLNLLDAIRCFERDDALRASLGAEFSNAYVKIKHAEWNSYCRHLTQWERDNTLDC